MRIVDALFVGVVLLVGVIYELMALKMPRGNLAHPGPGFYPILVGIFFIFAAASCFIRSIVKGRAGAGARALALGPDEQQTAVSTWVSLSKTIQLLGVLLFYGLTLQFLGFVITIFVSMVMSIRIFGYRRWLFSLLIAGIIVAISYLLFVVWLKVPLPRGFWNKGGY